MTDTTALRARLEEEKARLEGELETVGRRNPANAADWEPVQKDTGPEADLNDRAEQLEQYNENTSILNELEIRYNEVRNALSRMDDGSYGTCRICGKEIEAERLEADPSADTCLEHRDQ